MIKKPEFFTYIPEPFKNIENAVNVFQNPQDIISKHHKKRDKITNEKNGFFIRKEKPRKPLAINDEMLQLLFVEGYETLMDLAYLDKNIKKIFKKQKIEIDNDLKKMSNDIFESFINGKFINDEKTLIKNIATVDYVYNFAEVEKFQNKLSKQWDWLSDFYTSMHVIQIKIESIIEEELIKIGKQFENEYVDLVTQGLIENDERLHIEAISEYMDYVSNHDYVKSIINKLVDKIEIEISLEELLDKNKRFYNSLKNLYDEKEIPFRALAVMMHFIVKPSPKTIYFNPIIEDNVIYLNNNIKILMTNETKEKINEHLESINYVTDSHTKLTTAQMNDLELILLENKKIKHPVKKEKELITLLENHKDLRDIFDKFNIKAYQLNGLTVTDDIYKEAYVAYEKEKDLYKYFETLAVEIIKNIHLNETKIITKTETITVKNEEYEKQLEQRIKELEKQLQPFETLKDKYSALEIELEQAQEDLKTALKQTVQTDKNQTSNENDYDEEALMKLFNDAKTVFIGGDQNLLEKLTKLMPNIHIMYTEELNISYDKFKTADYIIFNTSMANHSAFKKVKDNKPKDVPILFINHQYGNPKVLLKEVHNQMKRYNIL